MIDINLVPPNLRKKKKKQFASILNIPQEAVIGLAGGLVVLLLIVHVLLQIVIFGKYIQHAGLKKQWDQILSQKETVERVINDLRGFQAKIKSLDEITVGKRILWAPKLNTISDSLPREIWLNKIALDKRTLLIDGSAVSKVQNEMISVGNFVANLKKQKYFMDDLLNVELTSIQRRKIKSLEVADFFITSKLK